MPLVRILGPVGIKDYVLEELYDHDSGYCNVFYRIVAPALCSTVLVALFGIIVLALGGSAPTYSFLSLVFYWLFLAVIKLAHNIMISKPAFILEAITSVTFFQSLP